MKDFIPSSDNALVTWSANHKTKVDTQAATLGLTASEVATEKASCDAIIDAIAAVAAAKGSYESAVTHKELIVKNELANIRNFAKDVKRKTTYTNAIGSDLGIVGASTTFDANTYKSTLKIENHPGYLILKFTKKGVEGINLYSRSKGESVWTKINFFAHSPCVDARPLAVAGQAENREYMCIGVIKDAEIGLQSDIVSVAYAG